MSGPVRPAGVLFDAGGTLVQVHVQRLGLALAARGFEPADLDEAFWRALVLLDGEFAARSEAWHEWFVRWLARFGEHADVPPEVLTEAWYEADAQQHLWDLAVTGAADCLLRLRAEGLRLGVVSNADGRIAEALDRAGLASLVDVIVDSTVVGVEKPHPAIFRHALEPLGLVPAEAWYLGDTVTYDAAGADAAGLLSWIVDHRGHHTLPHPRRVSSLAEFTDAALGLVPRERW